MTKTRIAVIHGPNLNMLGSREPEVYGNATLDDINLMLSKEAEKIKVQLDFFQSNSEGSIIDFVQNCAQTSQGIIINAGAYTHTSVAIRDALAAVAVPAVEVHISNVYSREKFRHRSLIAPVCIGQVTGFGPFSYTAALLGLVDFINRK